MNIILTKYYVLQLELKTNGLAYFNLLCSIFQKKSDEVVGMVDKGGIGRLIR